jgi:hypothetical protein
MVEFGRIVALADARINTSRRKRIGEEQAQHFGLEARLTDNF